MVLKILKWSMFVAALLFTWVVLAGGPNGGAAIGALGGGMWISFTMLYLYDRHLEEGNRQKHGGEKQ